MYTVLAIEGIDRIGKSTFINAVMENLKKKTELPVHVEKPTIGINTLHNIGYPLADVPGIMEIRNIGLMEEFLYRAQDAYIRKHHEIIIRDRFNLSELAYGECYRAEHFKKVTNQRSLIRAISDYRKWNNWFEEEMDKVANVLLVTFVLDKESRPNEDEAISARELVKVNQQFNDIYETSAFQDKELIELHKDQTTGMTDIMLYVDIVTHRVIDLL